MKKSVISSSLRTTSASHDFTFFPKTILGAVILVFIMIGVSYKANAQNPNPGLPNYSGTLFNYGHLSTIPPLTTDMPYDVMVAYIALDSVRRNLELKDIKAFLSRQTYNDTMRTIMKYFYKVVDWNPMQYESYRKITALGKIHPSMIDEEILQKYSQIAPSLGNFFVASSFFIYHIRVVDTLRFFDSTANTYQRGLKCYSEIMDIIKGKPVNSPCYSSQNNIRNENYNKKTATLQDTNFLFCFDIGLDWPRGKDPEDMVLIGKDNYPWTGIKEKLIDSNDKPWITANTEYIVFLSPVIIDLGAVYNTYQLFPVGYNSLTYGMYPIINGMVQDPSNDFGLGTSVPYNMFIQKMQQIIDNIKNYPN